MKSKFLFPAWGNFVGYLMAIPGFILGYYNTIKDYEIPGFGFRMREKNSFFQAAFENFTNELIIFLVIIGLVLIAFSRKNNEDELSARLRLNSLFKAIKVYYVLFILCVIYSKVIGEISYIGSHLFELNIFTPLVIFIVRYNYLRYIKKESYIIDHPWFLNHNPFRTVGIAISSLSFLIFLYALIVFDNNWNNEVLDYSYIFLIIGLFIWAFSKRKLEDEMTMQQRLESLQLAVYFNYALLLLGTMITYSLLFLYFLMFTQSSLLLFYIIRMEYVNFKNNQLLRNFERGMSYEK